MSTMSIGEASGAGVPALVSSAQRGEPVALTSNGSVVAEVVSAEELAELRHARETLFDVTMVLTRLASDGGHRTDLDDVIEAFGLDRAQLETELAAEIAVGNL